MPGVYADIMSTSLAKRAEIAIVGRLSSRQDLNAEMERLAPDVVFIGLEKGEGNGDVNETLYACPKGCVVAVSFDGRNATVQVLRPESIALGAVHPDVIASAIFDHCLDPMN
jgi:AmiR/NasT family two-component response regulator